MSLNAVYVVFLEFDLFRNVGLIHQGIYYLRVQLQSQRKDRIMFYKSNPCMKSNICDNRPVQDAMNYYKPCSVDVENNTFITRSILIRYQGEEASMRDSCCWRIEVPFDVIDDASLSFNVDLYFHQPIKSDNRVIAYAEKPTFIGSQSILVSRVTSDSELSYVRLLFPEQGLCEVKGVLHCSLVDVRYHSIEDNEPMPYGDYLAMGCDSFTEIESRYSSLSNTICKYLESSYYHLISCVKTISIQFSTADMKTISPPTTFQAVSAPSTPVIELSSEVRKSIHHSRSLSAASDKPFIHKELQSPKSVYKEFRSPPPPCGSPRIVSSQSPVLESLLCKEFRLDISSPMSPGKVDLSSGEVFVYDRQQEEDLRTIGVSFADQLSKDVHFCSSQLWQLHDLLIELIQQCIGVIVEVLGKQHERSLHDFYNRFALVNRLSKTDICGDTVNVLEDHLAMFDTVLHSQYFAEAAGSDILENDSLFTYAFTSEGILQCPLLLVDRYDTSRLMTSLSKEESNTWICSNPSCKHLNLTNVERCPFCLTYRSVPSLHVVFLLHGFRAEPRDMRKIADLLSLKYPHLKIIPLQACLDNTTKSMVILASMIAKEMASQLASLPSRTGKCVSRISFIGHSIGSVVIRLALRNPLLQNYHSCYHLFLSLNAPHLGVEFSKKAHEWGKKVLSLVNSSALVEELLLKDGRTKRNSLIYRMAMNANISHFKYFYVFSSCQDTFIPFHCVRGEVTPSIQSASSEEAAIYEEMVYGFWKDVHGNDSENHTIIKKFDVYYDNIDFSIDSIIGKTAHNNILRDVTAIQLLIYQMEECFA